MTSGNYCHVIDYTYSYKGALFQGNRLRSLQVLVNWRQPAEQSACAYPVGAAVEVFVDPQHPRESVLEPGGHSKFLPFFLGFSSMAVGIGIWLMTKAR
jgi:hypothetical protein